MIRNLIKRICKCIFPEKTPEIDEEMYKRILEYRSKEEVRFKEESEQNAKFLYGNLQYEELR